MARNEFDEFCRDAFRFLEEAEAPYLVIGGLAVIALGEPRTTADVDVIAFLDAPEAESLIARALAAGFRLDGRRELERLRETGTITIRRDRFHLDVILASLPFEQAALERARRRTIFGRSVPFPTAEDLLIFKVLAGRDKDLLDARGVLRRHRGKLDTRYVEEAIRAVCDLAEDMGPWNRWLACLEKSAD